MPECEYFVTSGCISPFNCPYKIEENYQNSAFTSGNSNFLNGIEKWFMQLVEEGKIPQTPMNYDMASYKAYVAHLEAENATLQKRLNKALELPFSIGDMAYYCDYIDYKGYVIIERKIVGIKQIKNEPKWWDRRESFMAAIVQGKKQDNDEIGEWCYDIDAFGTEWWTDRAAAEKRLAERGGEK